MVVLKKNVIVGIQPANGAKWGPGDVGTPVAGSNVVMLVFTKKITQTKIDTMEPYKWRVTRDGDEIPNGIEVIP